MIFFGGSQQPLPQLRTAASHLFPSQLVASTGGMSEALYQQLLCSAGPPKLSRPIGKMLPTIICWVTFAQVILVGLKLEKDGVRDCEWLPARRFITSRPDGYTAMQRHVTACACEREEGWGDTHPHRGCGWLSERSDPVSGFLILGFSSSQSFTFSPIAPVHRPRLLEVRDDKWSPGVIGRRKWQVRPDALVF